MANATVEKLKSLGLRHGEKVAVTLASLVFVSCIGLAATMKTIPTTPEQLKAAADASDQNLNRRIPPEQLEEKIEAAGIVPTNFSKEVEDQSKTLLVADDYRPQRSWVIPEPGAGYIRDTPKLIAVTELYAYPGRGGTLTYALDEKGNKILDDGTQEKPKERLGVVRRRSRMGAARGAVRRSGRTTQLSQAEFEKQQEKIRLEEQKKISSKLAGKAGATPEEIAKEKEEERLARESETQGGPFKEVVKGLRWVVLTGVLDHAKLVENYRQALKNPAVAHPFYKRLNLQRQILQHDNTWSAWQDVATEKNLEILDNLTEGDEEMTPETVRPPALVDPLPFLRAGFWEKVHIASLVPKERRELPKAQVAPAGAYGGMMDDPDGRGGRGGRGRGGMGVMGPMGGMGVGAGPMGGRGGGMPGAGVMGEDEGRGMGGRGGMAGRGMGFGSTESINYWKSEEPKIMVRALDFTVVPDTTYRYRVQIVVWNPNKGREDISPGTDKTSIELVGPWSEPTDPVAMPADVSPYVMASMPPTPRADTKLRFQVIRFDPQNGATVTRNMDYGPGDVIGEPVTAQVPTADGTGAVTKNIDFTSRQILLDVLGSPQPLPAGINGAPLDSPVVALLLRPDGALVIHNEADDEANEVRKDTNDNYRREIDESRQERRSSMGGRRGRAGRGGGRR